MLFPQTPSQPRLLQKSLRCFIVIFFSKKIPTLFSLLGALDEPRPVVIRYGGKFSFGLEQIDKKINDFEDYCIYKQF